MRVGTLQEWVGYSIALILILLVVPPFLTNAEGTEADAMCDPFIEQCGCGEKPNPKTGKCEKKGGPEINTKDCPMYCKDNTNGHMTVGHCVALNKCKGDTCDGKPCEKAKEGGKPPEMPKLPEPPKGGDEKGQPGDPNATSTDKGREFVDFMIGTSTTASSTESEGSKHAIDQSSVSTSGAPPTLEGYIQQLRGYFVNGIPGVEKLLNSAGSPASSFTEKGFNANLGEMGQLSPPREIWETLLHASSRGSSGAQRVIESSGASGNGSMQENQGGGVGIFRESSATGFQPPQAQQTSSGFLGNSWDALKALFGF